MIHSFSWAAIIEPNNGTDQAKQQHQCSMKAFKDNPESQNKNDGTDAIAYSLSGDGEPSSTLTGSFWRRSCFYLTSHYKTLLLGQVLSFLLASGGAAQATLHFECGLSSPTFTMSLIYLVLSTHLLPLLWRQKQGRRQVMLEPSNQEEEEESPNYSFMGLTLQGPVWKYLIIAFLDVEANAITMLSFRYTTLTSVTLFDACAIPSAMIISWRFLGRKYTWIHLVGVMTCMAGVIFNVMQDYESDTASTDDNNASSDEYPHKLRGDILAIMGGIMYGLNDVLTEATVRRNGETTEYLGLMGVFAFGISLVQALLLEWQDILEFFGEGDAHSSTCSLEMGWWLLFAFVGVTIMSYKGASAFLMLSEAAFFNLSLLTGDLWSIIFSIVAERIIPQPMFFVALIFVLSGVILYEMAASPVLDDNNDNGAIHERMPQSDNDFESHNVADESKGSVELT